MEPSLSGLQAIQPDIPPPSLTPGEAQVIFNPEGTVTVDDGPIPTMAAGPHDANLAESMEDKDCAMLASKILELIEIDERSRSDWQERLKRGTELLGLKNIGKDEIKLEGGSGVTHPVIAEAIIQFQARAAEELLPAAGPVKSFIVGEENDEVVAQADRVQTFMNYELVVGDEEYYPDADRMLFYLPMSGSAFKKCYIDPLTGKAISRFVTAEDMIVPYSVSSLYSSPRHTHQIRMPMNDLKRAQANGFYCHAELTPTLDTKNDKISDISDTRTTESNHEDDVRTLYETHIEITVPGFEAESEDFDSPYIITIDKDSRKILSIRRNWDQADKFRRKQLWFVHYRYLPGLGFYGLGLLHILGSIGEAASGILRALVDAGVLNNIQGGFKSKEARSASGDLTLSMGKWVDVNMTAEELKDAFYTPPFKEPSATLFRLLGLMQETAQRVASTTEALVGDAANTGPVGTTVALIEQGMKVFSGIHKRMHAAASREFKLLAKLHKIALPKDYPYTVHGVQQSIKQSDFDDRVDVIPVSDPNIFSNTQRIALAQTAMQLVSSNPDIYPQESKRKVHLQLLRALRIPDPEGLLPDQTPNRYDPVTENQRLLIGKPVKAFLDQNHQAHIASHMAFMQDISVGAPQNMQLLQPVMMAHMSEHYAYGYRVRIQQVLGAALPPIDMNADNPPGLPPEIENQIALAVGQIGPMVQPPMQPQPGAPTDAAPPQQEAPSGGQ